MALGLKYEMRFKNTEDQNMIVKIYDKLFAGANPYGFAIAVIIGSNDVTITYRFSWLPMPANVTNISIGYYDGAMWIMTPVGLVSPVDLVFPHTATQFRATLIFDDASTLDIDLNNIDPQIKQLTPSGDPFETSVVENNEDKTAPIKPLQAVIRFISDPEVTLSTFAQGGIMYDDRYFVTAEVNEGKFIFQGYLVFDDTNEPFLDKRNEVVLRAADRLGTLKEKAMVKFDGKNPTGANRIAQYVAWCLRYTGLSLPINVASNLREESSYFKGVVSFVNATNTITVPNNALFWQAGHTYKFMGSANNNVTVEVTAVGSIIVATVLTVTGAVLVDEANVEVTVLDITNPGCWWDKIKIDAKTFEKEIGSCIDCYQVLEYILRKHAFITQEKGEWWVYSWDEYDWHPVYVNRFDAEGNFIEEQPGKVYNKTIQRGTPIFFASRSTNVSLKRPNKFAKLTYNYDLPKELLCNIDLSRGTGPEPVGDTIGEEIVYEPECWELKSGRNPGTGLIMAHNEIDDFGPAAGVDAGLRKIFDIGFEQERYLFIEHATVEHYWKAEPFYVEQKAKLGLSFDYKRMTALTGGSLNAALVTLDGDDGSLWAWKYNETTGLNEWADISALLTSAYLSSWLVTNAGTQEDWESVKPEVLPVPVSGNVTLRMLCNDFGVERRFNNVRFEYTPYINGSYQKFRGRYDKAEQPTPDGQLLANEDETVKISDSPTKNYKGALLKWNGANDVLCGRFYNAAVIHDTAPTEEQLHTFGFIQTYALHNQYRNLTRIFRSSRVQGLDADAVDDYGRCDAPGLIHKYILNDASEHGREKWFMLLGYKKSWKYCSWSGTFAEVMNKELPKVYDDDYERKLISE